MGEVFDHVVKKMSYRRQKRWWNAYTLFYTKEDIDVSNRISDLTINEPVLSPSPFSLSLAIDERSVRKQNIKFQDTYNQFSTEFFPFMKKLIGCQTPYLSADSKTPSDKSLSLLPSLDPVDIEEVALLSAEIGARFLFPTCLHTNKSSRGVASDWYEALLGPLKVSKQARLWFGQCVLLDHPHRFASTCFNSPAQKFAQHSWKSSSFWLTCR